MEIIKPSEISGKIMSLIREAKEHLIIISPYNNISAWHKLLATLEKSKKRGINIEWYIRKGEGNPHQIKSLGIAPKEIENLHAKIYLNEKEAIVTSMNLNQSSDTKSLDIGYLTKNNDEYLDIVYFVNEYIKRDFIDEQKSKISNIKVAKKTEQVIANQSILSLQNNKNIIEVNVNNKQFENLAFLLKVYINTNLILNKFKLIFSETKKGNLIKLRKFKENYEIVFEINQSPRLILNILGDYKFRKLKYKELENKQTNLETEIGLKIDYGNEMLRLKFPLNQKQELEETPISSDVLIQRIDKIIQALYQNIN